MALNIVLRTLLTLPLLALLAFCVFGFLASYESADLARRLPWQLGYAGLGVACLLCAVFLWRGDGSR